MALRCKPGDLAMVTSAPPIAAELLGRIVRVVELIESDHWRLETPVRFTPRADCEVTDGHGGWLEVDSGQSVEVTGMADSLLTPIRPGDAADEPTSTTMPAPDERAVLIPQV